ncbi:hypothetical protein JWG44_10680 [Leptospira sp. 201903071]|uniref:hypothetical protein n=1 Tax=Leptospira ainazelensis TaxID=2810034 RepID=UPI001962E507|nr:hypothetical protein [Leptospira ainazelensis]MBM9500711.1 hypothetical protein [Leptospira ainazelensis]
MEGRLKLFENLKAHNNEIVSSWAKAQEVIYKERIVDRKRSEAKERLNDFRFE